MEAAIGFLFILLFLLILLLPVVILFGLVGLAFQSLWAAVLFALKYLLPAGVIGLIVGLSVGRTRCFEFRDYLKFIGGFMAAGLAGLFLIISMPVTPELPLAEQTASVTVSLRNGKTETEPNDAEHWRVAAICESLNNTTYKRTLTELIDDEQADVDVTFAMDNGETLTYTVCSDEVIAFHNGDRLQYFRVADEEAELPYDMLEDVVYDAERARNDAVWQPFADELFDSIYYDEEGFINFTIPSEAPAEQFWIEIHMMGVDGYTEGAFKPVEFHTFEEEQKNSSWELGATYRFPISTIVYSKFEFDVRASGTSAFTFDALALLPKASVHRLR